MPKILTKMTLTDFQNTLFSANCEKHYPLIYEIIKFILGTFFCFNKTGPSNF